ncbi:hypothetical protein [Actinomadura rupiterrae]|uniref:hypothetical protein n=1 Tax=Actinomadura rupiterrae TaxID=559627 RepID=UPI0020A33FE2|nr:hypothetical protein [Actinomadura rupiterrae]MCP2339215.1 hypothetical protein [Actinomadura rupiterrae]
MSAPCGTTSGYQRHIRHGERPCDACRKVNSAHTYARHGEAQRARTRALTRLAHAHPDAFAALEIREFAADGVTTRSGPAYQRAHRRAKSELARLLPTEYADLLAAELAAEAHPVATRQEPR